MAFGNFMREKTIDRFARQGGFALAEESAVDFNKNQLYFLSKFFGCSETDYKCYAILLTELILQHKGQVVVIVTNDRVFITRSSICVSLSNRFSLKLNSYI